MIKNLSRQLNEAGKIKIGKKGTMITSANGKEFRPPKKLDHFQLVTTEKDKNGDYVIDVDLQNKIKESGAGLVNKNGSLIGLPIRLLYNDTELNFPNRYVSYMSGQMSCYGDGETSHKRIDNFKKEHTCPCDRVTAGYSGKDKCKPTGTLTCVIDEAGLFGQAHKFRTTSMNTVKGILGGIELIKTATNGKIAGLPLMLTMNAKQTVTPQGIPTTVYIVSICYRGSMDDLRKEVLQLLTTEKQYLLSMDTIEANAKMDASLDIVDPEDEKDFVEEFFPDAAVVDVGQEKQPEKVEKTIETSQKKAVEEGQKKDLSDQVQEHDQSSNPEQKQEQNLNQEQKIIPDTKKKVLEPVGSYKKIYDKFIAEKNIGLAYSFAKRLQKGNLLFWLDTVYPDVEVDRKASKSDILDTIKEVLKSTLTNANTDNATDNMIEDLSGAKDDDQNDNPKDETQTKPTYERSWDDSGKIHKEQLRELVRLKIFLEKEGVLSPDKWVDHVKYFIDADGNPISQAINLTHTQGETFITMLGDSVPVA